MSAALPPRSPPKTRSDPLRDSSPLPRIRRANARLDQRTPLADDVRIGRKEIYERRTGGPVLTPKRSLPAQN